MNAARNNPAMQLALETEFRQDFAIIADWVKLGSKVLDLGCGDGRDIVEMNQLEPAMTDPLVAREAEEPDR